MSTAKPQHKLARLLDLPARLAAAAWASLISTNWEWAAERYLPRVGAIVCLVVMTGLIFRVLLIPTHFSVWAYGDAQMFNAGEHFAHEGFVAHYFLPEIDPGNPHSFIANNGPNGRYSHYPALHAILNGVVIYAANALGSNDVVQLKQFLQIVYLTLVAIGLFGFFSAVRRIYGPLVATFFTVFLVGVRGYDLPHLFQFFTLRGADALLLLGLILVFAVFLQAALRDRVEPRRRQVLQKAGFALALALGFVAFPAVMPLQALVMQPYTTAYVYVPTAFLALAAALASDLSWWSWLPREHSRPVSAARLLAACGAVAFAFFTVTVQGLALLVDPLSVASPSDYFWGLNQFDRQKLAYFSQPDIRGVVAQFTRPEDILLFPTDFHGGDPHEVNPIVEFYLQRHGLILSDQWNLEYVCGVLAQDRARLEGRWKAYVKPRLFVVPDTSKNPSIEDFARGLTAAWAPGCG